MVASCIFAGLPVDKQYLLCRTTGEGLLHDSFLFSSMMGCKRQTYSKKDSVMLCLVLFLSGISLAGCVCQEDSPQYRKAGEPSLPRFERRPERPGSGSIQSVFNFPVTEIKQYLFQRFCEIVLLFSRLTFRGSVSPWQQVAMGISSHGWEHEPVHTDTLGAPCCTSSVVLYPWELLTEIWQAEPLTHRRSTSNLCPFFPVLSCIVW